MFTRFFTAIALLRNTLLVREKFRQLVNVKVQGLNQKYPEKRLTQPQARWPDRLMLLFVQLFSCCFWTKSSKSVFKIKRLVPKTEFGKSLAGFIIGIVLSLIYYWILTFMLHAERHVTTSLVLPFLFLMSLGLGFSQRIRLLSLVSIATVCSSTGRVIIFAYILLLLYRGPMANLSENASEMGVAISCAAQKAEAAGKEYAKKLADNFDPLVDVYRNIENATNTMIDRIQEKVEKVEETINALRDTLGSFDFEGFTAFDFWPAILNNEIVKHILGKFWWNLAKDALKAIGLWPKLDVTSVTDKVKHQLVVAKNRTVDHFRVGIKFDRIFIHNNTHSKNMTLVMKAVVHDVKTQVSWIWQLISLFSFLNPLLTFLVLIRAILYVRSYKKKLHYDNVYITSRVKKIDFQRSKMQLQTILPLMPDEAVRYMDPLSLRLTIFEKRKLFIGLTVILSYTSMAATYMLLDWLLYESVHLLEVHQNDFDVQVEGPICLKTQTGSDSSAVDQFYTDVLDSAPDLCSQNSTETKADEVRDTVSQCFPSPIEPDYDLYRRIALLLLFCLVTTLIESYTLRIRHVACDYYLPDRGDQRAGWLYNTILARRGDMAHFLQDQFKARLGFKGIERVTFMERLIATIPILRLCTSSHHIFCTSCGKRFDAEADLHELRRCESTANCPGMFCDRCVDLMDNTCSVCSKKIELPDSDISEEEDSEIDAPDHESESNSNRLENDPDLTRVRKNMKRLGNEFAHTNLYERQTDNEPEVPIERDMSPFSENIFQQLFNEAGVTEEEMKRMSATARKHV